jgi:hypothetical protein
MDIHGGLMDHQVLQRNRKDVSETTITGKTNSSGELQVHVCKNKTGKAIPGFNWKTIVRVKPVLFTAKLIGIPVGGPYEISLRIKPVKGDPLPAYRAKDVLVGDVWILGGQSNMAGYGNLSGAAKPHPMVRAFYMDDRWAVAKDPIHNVWVAADPIQMDRNRDPIIFGNGVGTGPGVAFGQTMHKLSGVPQAVIPCAHGGTTMPQWDPALKKSGGKSFYGAALRRFHKSGARVAGIVWYQGCGETLTSESISLYTPRMKKLVAAFRKDMDHADLPFVMAQLASVFISTVPTPEVISNWNSIQDRQRLLPTLIKNLTTIPTIDLQLEDGCHVSGAEQNRLGRRLAEAAWSLMKKPKALKPPITLKSIRMPFPNNPNIIEVTFGNVEGKLVSQGRPNGFNVLIPDDIQIPSVYRIDLDWNKATIYSAMSADIEASYLSISYGFGLNTYCNITDQADRSLPVLGPQPYYQNRKPRTGIKTLRVSNYLPGAGRLQKVKCPDPSDPSLGFRTVSSPDSFINLHNDLQYKTDDALVFFAAKFRCEEPMKLDIGFGYDGPAKMWIDGKQVYYDPRGINPMIRDQHLIPFSARTGEHEIIIAFSANFGRAWGISMRLFRNTVMTKSLHDIRSVKMPVIIG